MSGDLLKVLYCSFDVIPEPTGTSARATDFIRGLTPVFNVDGLTIKSADHSHIERYSGMRLMRVPVGAGDLPVRAQTFERAVRRQLESDEYQLVHFTDPYGGYALCEMRQQYNFKLLYEVVGFPSVEVKYTHPHLEGDRRFMSKLRRQELFCLMNADAVLVGSEQTAAMVRSLGVSPERTTVIRAGADVSLYSPIDEMPKPDRDPMRLIYLGNQNAWQGLSTLLFAMSISAQLAQVRLSIVGPQHPTWRLQLEEMVKYRKLSGLVEFVDPVPHDGLAKVLAGADVGVAPLEKNDRNTVQGAPLNKVAHYLAAGRPVIASNLPIVREVSDESCTLYHEPGDENDLAEKIVMLARDPARRVAMGERAHAFAKEKLHADVGRTALLKLYAAMLGGVSSPESADKPKATEDEAQASYAPTSVGAAAEQPRDEATQTAAEKEREKERDHITDPFRKVPESAVVVETSPKVVVQHDLDGPPTPPGGVAAPGATPDPTPPEAAPMGISAPEQVADDVIIDEVDPLEFDLASVAAAKVAKPAVELPPQHSGPERTLVEDDEPDEIEVDAPEPEEGVPSGREPTVVLTGDDRELQLEIENEVEVVEAAEERSAEKMTPTALSPKPLPASVPEASQSVGLEVSDEPEPLAVPEVKAPATSAAENVEEEEIEEVEADESVADAVVPELDAEIEAAMEEDPELELELQRPTQPIPIVKPDPEISLVSGPLPKAKRGEVPWDFEEQGEDDRQAALRELEKGTAPVAPPPAIITAALAEEGEDVELEEVVPESAAILMPPGAIGRQASKPFISDSLDLRPAVAPRETAPIFAAKPATVPAKVAPAPLPQPLRSQPTPPLPPPQTIKPPAPSKPPPPPAAHAAPAPPPAAPKPAQPPPSASQRPPAPAVEPLAGPFPKAAASPATRSQPGPSKPIQPTVPPQVTPPAKPPQPIAAQPTAPPSINPGPAKSGQPTSPPQVNPLPAPPAPKTVVGPPATTPASAKSGRAPPVIGSPGAQATKPSGSFAVLSKPASAQPTNRPAPPVLTPRGSGAPRPAGSHDPTRQTGTHDSVRAAHRPGAAPPVLYPTSGERKAIPRSAPEAAVAPARPPATPVVAPPAAAPKVLRTPVPEGPIEVDSTDFEAIPAQVTLTPPSGLPPSDEWLGHVLLGYAPFGVPCRPVLPESGESAAISRR